MRKSPSLAISAIFAIFAAAALFAATPAVAGKVVRDHRGQDTGTPVKVNVPTGRTGKDIGWGNYSKGKGGPTVRDHR
jgi:hypothetical protein